MEHLALTQMRAQAQETMTQEQVHRSFVESQYILTRPSASARMFALSDVLSGSPKVMELMNGTDLPMVDFHDGEDEAQASRPRG